MIALASMLNINSSSEYPRMFRSSSSPNPKKALGIHRTVQPASKPPTNRSNPAWPPPLRSPRICRKCNRNGVQAIDSCSSKNFMAGWDLINCVAVPEGLAGSCKAEFKIHRPLIGPFKSSTPFCDNGNFASNRFVEGNFYFCYF